MMNENIRCVSLAPEIHPAYDFVGMNLSKLKSAKNSGKYVPAPDIFNVGEINGSRIIFSPILSKLYAIKEETYERINSGDTYRYLDRLIDINFLIPHKADLSPPKYPLVLQIFVNSKCNLKCNYCAYDDNKDGKEIEFDFVKSVIDYLVEKNPNDTLRINFTGFGESTLAIDKIKRIHEYTTSKMGKYFSSIVTNGMFSGKVAEWLTDNMEMIGISCDGPPHIQNKQRPMKNGKPSSPIIEKNIKKILERRKEDLKISTVITKSSIGGEEEILNYFHSLGVKYLIFVTQLNCDWSKPGVLSFEDVWRINENALSINELAEDYGMRFSHGLLRLIPNHTGCKKAGREMDMTPEGEIIFCGLFKNYLEATNRPPDLNLAGYYDKKNKSLIIRDEVISNFEKRNIFNIPECSSCPAKWFCGSGCPMRALSNYGEFFKPSLSREECKKRKDYLKKYLMFRAEKNFIKIKPYLERRRDGLQFTMYFNEFKLNQVKNNGNLNGNCLVEINESCDMERLSEQIVRETKNRGYKTTLFLLSFNLSLKHLTRKKKAIIKSLSDLKKNKVYFKVTKPLPRCVFDSDYPNFVKEFNIPKTCLNCLELFTVKGKNLKMCNGKEYFFEEFADRKVIYNEFRNNFKLTNEECGMCRYYLRGSCGGVCSK